MNGVNLSKILKYKVGQHQSLSKRSSYDFLINGRFSVGSSDRHNIGSHRCNLVCYCTNEQGQSIGNPQSTFRVSSSTSFSEREGFKKKKSETEAFGHG